MTKEELEIIKEENPTLFKHLKQSAIVKMLTERIEEVFKEYYIPKEEYKLSFDESENKFKIRYKEMGPNIKIKLEDDLEKYEEFLVTFLKELEMDIRIVTKIHNDCEKIIACLLLDSVKEMELEKIDNDEWIIYNKYFRIKFKTDKKDILSIMRSIIYSKDVVFDAENIKQSEKFFPEEKIFGYIADKFALLFKVLTLHRKEIGNEIFAEKKHLIIKEIILPNVKSLFIKELDKCDQNVDYYSIEDEELLEEFYYSYEDEINSNNARKFLIKKKIIKSKE